MFLLSRILLELSYDQEVAFLNEREFSTLALLDSIGQTQICAFMESESYLGLAGDHLALLLTTPDLAPLLKDRPFGVAVTENPKLLFFKLHNFLANNDFYRRPLAPTLMGKDCDISPLASVARNNVLIGNNVTIEEFVVIRENTVIGDSTIIRAGSIIGGQGYQFLKLPDSIMSVEHLGGTVIGKNVEIQYNNCVARAIYPWDDTVIGDYCKFDDSVDIAHADKIGARTMIIAGTVIAGRVSIGDDCWLGVGATVRNGITIGDSARINMGAVVSRDVSTKESVTGNFAIPHEKFMKNLKESVK